jgi:hypothetical protein
MARAAKAHAFNVFRYGRMIGAAAEIDDHLNRGRNIDTVRRKSSVHLWSSK